MVVSIQAHCAGNKEARALANRLRYAAHLS